jgi:hypothetical protein
MAVAKKQAAKKPGAKFKPKAPEKYYEDVD